MPFDPKFYVLREAHFVPSASSYLWDNADTINDEFGERVFSILIDKKQDSNDPNGSSETVVMSGMLRHLIDIMEEQGTWPQRERPAGFYQQAAHLLSRLRHNIFGHGE